MLQKNTITEVLPDSPVFYSNVFLVRKVSGGWHPVIDLKQHFRTSLLYGHYKLSTEYHKKRRLCDQNISAGCVISCTNPSRQQAVHKFISVPSTSLRSEHCPSGIYSSGAHSAAYPKCQGISVIPYLDDWLIHHPVRQVLLCHQSQLLKTLELVGLKLNEGISELDPVQDIQFLELRYAWIKAELLSQNPKPGR